MFADIAELLGDRGQVPVVGDASGEDDYNVDSQRALMTKAIVVDGRRNTCELSPFRPIATDVARTEHHNGEYQYGWRRR